MNNNDNNNSFIHFCVDSGISSQKRFWDQKMFFIVAEEYPESNRAHKKWIESSQYKFFYFH